MERGLYNTLLMDILDIPKYVQLFTQKKEVLAIAGAPGIGKTSSIYYEAKIFADAVNKKLVINPTPKDWTDENYCVMTVLTSSMLEEDAKGIPSPIELEDGTKMTIYLKNEMWPQKGHGLIVYDEFANGKSSVLNALQQIILDRVAGNYKLSDGIQQIIATNRDVDNTGTNRIPSALRNRMGWIEVVPPSNADKWLKRMKEVGVYVDAQIAAWLLSIGSKYFYNFDADKEQYGYCTPRSIVKTSNLIKDIKDIKFKANIVSAMMGNDAGMDFRAFAELTESIDINGIVDNVKNIHEYEDNPGKMYAIFVEMGERYYRKQIKMQVIIDLLAESSKPEYGSFLLGNILDSIGYQKILTEIISCKNHEKVVSKYTNLLKEE